MSGLGSSALRLVAGSVSEQLSLADPLDLDLAKRGRRFAPATDGALVKTQCVSRFLLRSEPFDDF